MEKEFIVLMTTAASIGFIHTILGPDHYVPFIVMSKARQWNLAKTNIITFICGLGHVLSSIVLGFAGILLGTAVFKLESIESFRGDIAAWLLLIFGFTYFVWGVRRAILNKPHTHIHNHTEEKKHSHTHNHMDEHLHIHKHGQKANITPWVLFTIFVFGPCEPLIPVLMYPAAKWGIHSALMVATVFSVATIGTMLVVVNAMAYGLTRVNLGRFQRYSHATAGLAILLCAVAIFAGL